MQSLFAENTEGAKLIDLYEVYKESAIGRPCDSRSRGLVGLYTESQRDMIKLIHIYIAKAVV